MEILFVISAITMLYGVKVCTGRGEFFDDCLSLNQTSMIKGILSIFIVLHHIAPNVSDFDPTGVITLFTKLGYVFVGIFFFLSGYGLQLSYMKKQNYLDTFLKRKLEKLVIPFTVYIIIYIVAMGILGDDVKIATLVGNYFNGRLVNGHLWYIIILLMFYALFYVFARVFKRKYIKIIVAVFGCTLIYILCCMYGNFGAVWCNTSLNFTFGLLFALYNRKIISMLKAHWLSILASEMLILAVLFAFEFVMDLKIISYSKTYLLVRTVFTSFNASLITIIAVMITQKVKIGNKLLGLLGGISMEIYMSHYLFLRLYHSDIININSDLMYALSVMISTIAFSLIMSKLFKRIHFSR